MDGSEKTSLEKRMESIKNFQLSIATQMNIDKRIVDLLKSEEKWDKREWLYLCAIDGVSYEEIQFLISSASIDQIIKYKRMYNCEKFGNYESLSSLLNRLAAMMKDAEKFKNKLDQIINEAEKEKVTAYESLVKEQEKLIHEQQLRIQMLENEMESMKIVDTKNKGQDISVEIIENGKGEEIMKERRTEAVESSDMPEVQQLELKKDKKTIWKRLRTYFCINPDTKKFINNYLENDEYDDGQKEFLIDCLQEGIRVNEIERFAAPGLSVDIMKRMKAYCKFVN